MRILILILFMTLLNLLAPNANAFWARFTDEYQNKCESDLQLSSKILQCLYTGKTLSHDIERDFFENLEATSYSDYADLMYLQQSSDLIQKNALLTLENYKTFDNEEKNSIKAELETLAMLELQEQWIDEETPQCIHRVGTRQHKECQESVEAYEQEHEEELALIAQAKLAILRSRPLLNESIFQEWTEEVADEKIKDQISRKSQYYEQMKREHCSSNLRMGHICTPEQTRVIRQLSTDYLDNLKKEEYEIQLEPQGFNSLFSNGLTKATDKINKLVERHQGLTGKFHSFFEGELESPNEAHDFLEEILKDQSLAADFYSTLPQLADNDIRNNSICHIAREYEANEDNQFINSLVLDGATLLIPFAGWGKAAHLIYRVSKSAKNANALAQLEKVRRSAMGWTITAEASTMGLDLYNLNQQNQNCESIKSNLVIHGNLDQIEAYKECVDQESMMSLYTGLAIVGGLAGTILSPMDIYNKVNRSIGKGTGLQGKRVVLTPSQQNTVSRIENVLGTKNRDEVLDYMATVESPQQRRELITQIFPEYGRPENKAKLDAIIEAHEMPGELGELSFTQIRQRVTHLQANGVPSDDISLLLDYGFTGKAKKPRKKKPAQNTSPRVGSRVTSSTAPLSDELIEFARSIEFPDELINPSAKELLTAFQKMPEESAKELSRILKKNLIEGGIQSRGLLLNFEITKLINNSSEKILNIKPEVFHQFIESVMLLKVNGKNPFVGQFYDQYQPDIIFGYYTAKKFFTPEQFEKVKSGDISHAHLISLGYGVGYATKGVPDMERIREFQNIIFNGNNSSVMGSNLGIPSGITIAEVRRRMGNNLARLEQNQNIGVPTGPNYHKEVVEYFGGEVPDYFAIFKRKIFRNEGQDAALDYFLQLEKIGDEIDKDFINEFFIHLKDDPNLPEHLTHINRMTLGKQSLDMLDEFLEVGFVDNFDEFKSFLTYLKNKGFIKGSEAQRAYQLEGKALSLLYIENNQKFNELISEYRGNKDLIEKAKDLIIRQLRKDSTLRDNIDDLVEKARAEHPPTLFAQGSPSRVTTPQVVEQRSIIINWSGENREVYLFNRERDKITGLEANRPYFSIRRTSDGQKVRTVVELSEDFTANLKGSVRIDDHHKNNFLRSLENGFNEIKPINNNPPKVYQFKYLNDSDYRAYGCRKTDGSFIILRNERGHENIPKFTRTLQLRCQQFL